MKFLRRDLMVREPLLVSILVVVTIVLSILTHTYTEAYNRRRASLSREWFERAKLELKNHRPSLAIDDLRTALLYAPRNQDFTMYLADALTQAGHPDQAFNYYLGLWQGSPNSGKVNLQLARLSAQKGDFAGAERYFNGAIFGDWPENPAGHRREASLELIDFYLSRGDSGHAESQLIILSDNLPEDAPLHVRVAELYSRVGDEQRALKEYRRAIELDPNDGTAMQGAGENAFRLGDYRAAAEYLNRSLRFDESNTSVKRSLAVIQSVSSLNPYEHGITEAEKIRRVLRAFEVAGNRLASCLGSAKTGIPSSIEPVAERWRQLKATADTRFLHQHPEEIDTLIDFSISAERTAQAGCAEMTSDDSALLAIANQREGANR